MGTRAKYLYYSWLHYKKYFDITIVLAIKMQYRFLKSFHKFYSERSDNDHLHISIKSYNPISSVLDRYYELDFSVPNFSMYSLHHQNGTIVICVYKNGTIDIFFYLIFR